MRALALFCLLLLSSSAFARLECPKKSDNFWRGHAEGWFWHQDCVEVPDPPPEPEKKPEVVVVVPSAKDKPKEAIDPSKIPYSVAWLRKQMPILIERAMDNPTKENVAAYYYVQRVLMDKSQNFAEKAREVTSTDPLLDETNRIPLSTLGAGLFGRLELKAHSEAMKYLSQKGAIWLFYSSTCDYCSAQIRTVKEMSKKYGFITHFIAVDGKSLPGIEDEFIKDTGQAKALRLTITPTTIFAVPPKEIMIVSQGLMSTEALEDRIIIAANAQKVIPPEMVKDLNRQDRGVLSPEDMKGGATDDPVELINNLRKKLEGKY